MDNCIRTDLASELIKTEGKPRGGVCTVSEIDLDAELAQKFNKSEGKYVTLETGILPHGSRHEKLRLARALSDELDKLIPDKSRVLIVGLGNAGMTADALGSDVCRDIDVESGKLMTLCPSVAGNTGIESFDIVKGVSDRIRPSAIVAVDSLAAASTERVSRVIQLCNAGITPGSGVSNHRERLSARTLGVPVISIGVPLVVYASTIIRDAGGDTEGFESLIVTPKDIDIMVHESALVIAQSLNRFA